MDSIMMRMQEEPIWVLMLYRLSVLLVTNPRAQNGGNAPKVDETHDESRDDGKVGKVEAQGGPAADRHANVVMSAHGAIQGDGDSNQDVANRTGKYVSFMSSKQRLRIAGHVMYVHGNSRLPPA